MFLPVHQIRAVDRALRAPGRCVCRPCGSGKQRQPWRLLHQAGRLASLHSLLVPVPGIKPLSYTCPSRKLTLCFSMFSFWLSGFDCKQPHGRIFGVGWSLAPLGMELLCLGSAPSGEQNLLWCCTPSRPSGEVCAMPVSVGGSDVSVEGAGPRVCAVLGETGPVSSGAWTCIIYYYPHADGRSGPGQMSSEI